jgi:hypothetical protein
MLPTHLLPRAVAKRVARLLATFQLALRLHTGEDVYWLTRRVLAAPWSRVI